MPKFDWREIPEAGKLSQERLHAISQKSCGVLRETRASDSMGAKLCHR